MAYINKIVVNGSEVNANQLEGILDKDGHERFIEGNVSVETITGLTQTYGKWSLSGTHLMLVLAGSIESGTTIADGSKIASSIAIPNWILDKITPTSHSLILYKTEYLLAEDWTRTTFETYLNKEGQLVIRTNASLTTAKDYTFRMQFDLIIDNA